MRLSALGAALAALVFTSLNGGCVMPPAKSNGSVSNGPVAMIDGHPIYDEAASQTRLDATTRSASARTLMLVFS